LKKLDKLTGEEAKMATAEVLKSTRNVDDNVKMLIDGIQREFFGQYAVLIFYIARWQGGKSDFATREAFVIFTPAAPFTWGSVMVTGKQIRQDLHSWLSPPDSSTNHNIACNAHHEGTASWFFQGSMFEKWRSTPSLLWIHGKRMFPSLFTP
jgi:hypothetical protein